MSKGTPVTKLVNGEIADADVVNQIAEDVGSQGGSVPYDPTTNQKSTNGSQSLGATSTPWGSLFVNQNANLVEVDPSSNTASATVAWSNLRRFLFLKDCPSTFVGQGGLFLRANIAESALEFFQPSNNQLFISSGTFTAPAGITKVYVTMVAGGGGGAGINGGSSGGGGGGGGEQMILRPYTVVGGNSYTVTIGAGGAKGTSSGTDGSTGGTTSFDALSVSGGVGGKTSNGNGGSGGGGTNGVGMDASASISTASNTGGKGTIRGGNGAKGGSGGGGGSGGTIFGDGLTGGNSGGNNAGTSGGANTGVGGSGGANFSVAGGDGGSGVVLISY